MKINQPRGHKAINFLFRFLCKFALDIIIIPHFNDAITIDNNGAPIDDAQPFS